MRIPTSTYLTGLILTAIFSTLLLSCQPDTGCRTEIKVVSDVSVEWINVDSLEHPSKNNTWDSVSVMGIGSEMLLYKQSTNVKTLRLPLRGDTCVSDFLILWHGNTDILHIHHQNDRHYISLACGCTIYHTIDSVWSEGTFIEHAEIINSSVENYEQENIHIRLKTQYEK